MDGRGRALDNVFVERLWRTVKYEHVYLHDYVRVPELEQGLKAYFRFYNHERLHQSLSYQTLPVKLGFHRRRCILQAVPARTWHRSFAYFGHFVVLTLGGTLLTLVAGRHRAG